MTVERRRARWGAVILTLGVVVFGAASLFHPPTANPWDATAALQEASESLWLVDHLLLLVGIVALDVGLFILHGQIVSFRHSRLAHPAFAFTIASLTLWVSLFVFELTGWRILAQAVAAQFGSASQMPGPESAGAAGVLSALAHSAWTTTIILGYGAAFLLGLAIWFWSIAALRGYGLPRGVAWFGVIVGLITIVTLPLAIALPRAALWLVIPAAGLLGLWLLAAAWAMWRGVPDSSA